MSLLIPYPDISIEQQSTGTRDGMCRIVLLDKTNITANPGLAADAALFQQRGVKDMLCRTTYKSITVVAYNIQLMAS